MDDTGWEASAAAWIASMGEAGDKGRRDVLDAPMLALARESGARNALDVGCGEGRFCRRLRELGIAPTGIDPTGALLAVARERDPSGDYRQGRAEDLPFPDRSFDLTVSYVTLVDIDGYEAAIGEMARVLRPGGTLLVANLAGHSSATPRDWPEGEAGWVRGADGSRRYFAMDDYLRPRSYWTSWKGIRIRNHHRPLDAYMRAFLGAGLRLTAFEYPPYRGTDAGEREKYERAPWFVVMAWRRDG